MISPSVIDSFKTSVRGEVLCPGEQRYDEAREIHNAMIDRHPATMVRCAGVADIIASVKFRQTFQHLPVDDSVTKTVRSGFDKLVPVGKETDRRWEQGDDPSMIDSDIFIYEKRTKLVIADPSERKRWSAIGVRRLIRGSKLSQAPVSNAIKGKPVRTRTLAIIRQTVEGILAE
jgi:hypothetical protein